MPERVQLSAYMTCQSYRKDTLCGASPRKPWRYLVRFVGRRLKQCKGGKTPVSRNRVNRFRRTAAGPPLIKAVAETFEPPPLSCGDYTLHLRMAESSIGLEDVDPAGNLLVALCECSNQPSSELEVIRCT